MGKQKTKSKWYAVARGRLPGVYRTWAEAEAQVRKYPGGQCRSFASQEEAWAWLHRQSSQDTEQTWTAYTDGSHKTESASASAVIVQGDQVVAQGQIGLPPEVCVGEAEGRAILLALLMAPAGARIRVHTDRADFAQQWRRGQTDCWGVLEAVRALARARQQTVEILKVPRKEVQQAHQQASRAHQERSRQRDLNRSVSSVLEQFPERYRMAVIRLVEEFLQSGQPSKTFLNWLRQGSSTTRTLLAGWCARNAPEGLLEEVQALNPALSKALQERDREAAWRQMPTTPRQLEYLKGLGYQGPAPANLLEASRLIERLLAERRAVGR